MAHGAEQHDDARADAANGDAESEASKDADDFLEQRDAHALERVLHRRDAQLPRETAAPRIRLEALADSSSSASSCLCSTSICSL